MGEGGVPGIRPLEHVPLVVHLGMEIQEGNPPPKKETPPNVLMPTILLSTQQLVPKSLQVQIIGQKIVVDNPCRRFCCVICFAAGGGRGG